MQNKSNGNGRLQANESEVLIYGQFLMGTLKKALKRPLVGNTYNRNDGVYGKFDLYKIYDMPHDMLHLGGRIKGKELARVEVSKGTYLGGFNRVQVFDPSLVDIITQDVYRFNQMYGLSLRVVQNQRHN